MRHVIPFSLLFVLLLAGCHAAEAPAAGRPDDSIPSPDSGEADPPPPGSGWDSRPRSTVTIPAAGESFFLTYWDGETLLEQFCYAQEDLDALAQALSEVRGYEVAKEDQRVPKDPWPIYGLHIIGTEKDFEAACCNGLWVDSEGHVLLEPEVDFSALWERFAKAPTPRTAPQPAIRELALCSGGWDSRFLREADGENHCAIIPMELTISDGSINWTITNQTGTEIVTGNSSSAAPQVLLDGVCYGVPMLSGAHYGWTLEAYTIAPGGTFSGSFWREPYGPLPDGDYRLVLFCKVQEDQTGWTAAPFQVRSGAFAPLSAEP